MIESFSGFHRIERLRKVLGWRWMFGLFSIIYRGILFIRRLCYRKRMLPSFRIPLRVISLGNLTTGGTGKTAAAASLARRLKDQGCSVAIVLRGYKRKNKNAKTLLVSNGLGKIAPFEEAGDEAVMLAQALPDVPIFVGSDRVAAARKAAREFKLDTIILDDGFQHLRIKRDKNIVLLDARDPFAGDRCLPLGDLRESPTALKDADGIIFSHADHAAPEEIRNAMRLLEGYAPGIPAVFARHAPLGLVAIHGGERRDCAVIRGEKTVVFAGIGSFDHFSETMTKLGAHVVGLSRYPDHYNYSSEDLDSITTQFRATEARYIVTTHKDKVRFEAMKEHLPEAAYYLEIGFEFMESKSWGDILR